MNRKNKEEKKRGKKKKRIERKGGGKNLHLKLNINTIFSLI